MTDDFSQLETGASCYVLNSASSIYSYKNNIRKTYYQVGGRWIYSSQTTYNQLPNNSVCLSYSDITGLSSNAQYYPIFLMISFLLGVCVWFLWWFLFRRLFKWRIS